MDFFKFEDADENNGMAWIKIATANRLLQERGTIVRRDHGFPNSWMDKHNRFFESGQTGSIKEQALLINIEPLNKDSAEKILLDMIAADRNATACRFEIDAQTFLARARRLFSGK